MATAVRDAGQKRWRASAGCAVSALALAACGAGNGSDADRPPGGATVAVYSSFPLSGPERREATAAVEGIRLALAESGGRVGGLRVTYRSLDHGAAKAGAGRPQAVIRNAQEAVRDGDTAVYIGELGDGTALSLPVTNEAGVAQIGIADPAVGLTTNEPGALPGEPEKYYPSTTRTFVRIVPRDSVLGAALVSAMRADGCARIATAVAPGAAGLASSVEAAAGRAGLPPVATIPIGARATRRRAASRPAGEARPDCVVLVGGAGPGTTRRLTDLRSLPRTARLYGSDALARVRFARGAGRASPALDRRLRLVLTTRLPEFPPAARRLLRRYHARYRHDARPAALYGYEAMRLALDAIRRSGDGSPAKVLKALFETRDRQSALGTYSIDDNGDTTLADFGLYSMAGGTLRLERTLKGRAVP